LLSTALEREVKRLAADKGWFTREAKAAFGFALVVLRFESAGGESDIALLLTLIKLFFVPRTRGDKDFFGVSLLSAAAIPSEFVESSTSTVSGILMLQATLSALDGFISAIDGSIVETASMLPLLDSEIGGTLVPTSETAEVFPFDEYFVPVTYHRQIHEL
jgi:hypothetical protein